jgi:LPS O-antigen subunit length determinant protein (WzzB/FepE family)
MSEHVNKYDDEIDLVEFFYTLWDGKWMILSIIVFSVFCVLGYLLTRPAPNFIATTEIDEIYSVEIDRYLESNAFGFYPISKENLQNLYIEKIEAGNMFEKAITKYELLDIESFETEADYNLAVLELAALIDLKLPANVEGEEGLERLAFGTIEFAYNDKDKWKAVLADATTEATAEVRHYLKDNFFTALAIAKQKQVFQLEDLAIQIENSKRDFDETMKEFEQTHSFQFEDVQTRIDNVIIDYDRKTAIRLAFLREQAAIARKLGVAKNTIEAQMFSAQNGIVTNVKTDTPFYLRGYEAIEKEIELIKSRTDKRAFMNGLFELDQKMRGLKQDKTLQRAELNKVFLGSALELEKKQRAIEQEKTFERAESLFAVTPIMSGDNFSAVSLEIEGTEFKSTSKRMLMLVVAILMGGMIGVFYVLIANAVRTRKLEIAIS